MLKHLFSRHQRLLRPAIIGVTVFLTACGSSSGTQPPADSPPTSSAQSSVSSSSSLASNSSSSQSSSEAAVELCGFENDSGMVITTTGTTRIEAENFDGCEGAYSDTSNSNEGEAYRELAVDISAHEQASNGFYVSHMQTGEYLEFSIDVEKSGLYTLSYQLRAGDSDSDASYRLTQNDTILKNSVITVLGGTDTWQTQMVNNVYLSDGPQVIRLEVATGGAGLDALELTYAEPLTLGPEEAVMNMGIGINLGNTLDAPYEGEWARATERHFLTDFRDAGFLHVRIPATWHNHTASEPPYHIDSERMARTEQIVDWALAEGLYVILNAHHESWLKEDYSSEHRARFDAIWQQISERFAHKSARLMFEILNEPVGMNADQVNDLNPRILGILREHNPRRLVVIAGHDYTGVHTLDTLEVPDDDYLIGNFHSYDPWAFAGQCTRRWGSQEDINELEGIYQRARDWSQASGIPLMLNEFGVARYDFTQPDNVCHQNDRLDYLHHHVNFATSYGIAASFWDDGGSFSSYDRDNRTWGDEKDVLVAPNP